MKTKTIERLINGAFVRTADTQWQKMLRDARVTGLGKLHRGIVVVLTGCFGRARRPPGMVPPEPYSYTGGRSAAFR
jgi:hypothetical protein